MKTTAVLLLTTAFWVLAPSHIAQAVVISDVFSEIDWNSFELTGDFSVTSSSTRIAQNQTWSVNLPAWDSAYSAFSIPGLATTGIASPDALIAAASAVSKGNLIDSFASSVAVERRLEFVALSDFSASAGGDYRLAISGKKDALGETNTVLSYASISLINWDAASENRKLEILSSDLEGLQNSLQPFDLQQTGLLSTDMLFSAGDRGEFWISLGGYIVNEGEFFAKNPVPLPNPFEEEHGPIVPEPSSLILLGSGLLGLFGFSRRK